MNDDFIPGRAAPLWCALAMASFILPLVKMILPLASRLEHMVQHPVSAMSCFLLTTLSTRLSSLARLLRSLCRAAEKRKSVPPHTPLPKKERKKGNKKEGKYKEKKKRREKVQSTHEKKKRIRRHAPRLPGCLPSTASLPLDKFCFVNCPKEKNKIPLVTRTSPGLSRFSMS